jgi:predicted nucleotidyltransferase
MPSPKLDAFAVLEETARARGLRVLLIGAMARQLVFDLLCRDSPYRLTRDIDAVVRVAGWEEFNALAADLTAQGFTKADHHRFRYRDGTDVDLLPYGGVADKDGKLTWEGSDRVLSLDGLAVADEQGQLLNVDGIQIRVTNLANLIALKMYALNDRPVERLKDLEDLVFVLENASTALQDRVFDELGPELAELEFDDTGPYLLGKDVAGAVSLAESDALTGILDTLILRPPDYRLLSLLKSDSSLELSIDRFDAFRRGLARKSS